MEYLCQAGKYIADHMILLNFFLSIVIIFFQRKEPKSAWAWLLVLNALPGFGFLLYLLAGTICISAGCSRSRESRIRSAMRCAAGVQRSQQADGGEKSGTVRLFGSVYFNLESGGAVLTEDNEIQIFTDGNDKFDALIEDIRNAEKYVFLQYYIIKNDVLFQRIRDALLEKAAQGVEIRILYDAMGCRSVHRKMWKELEGQGIRTAVFFPALLGPLHLRVNYRNHRKIAVIDGTIGYVGGFNIGKEYIGLDPKFGHWRDTHLRIRGSAVAALLIRYIQDWDYAAGKICSHGRNTSYIPKNSSGIRKCRSSPAARFRTADHPRQLSAADPQGEEADLCADPVFHPG